MNAQHLCDECGGLATYLYRYVESNGRLTFLCLDCREDKVRGSVGTDVNKRIYEEAKQHQRNKERRRLSQARKAARRRRRIVYGDANGRDDDET